VRRFCLITFLLLSCLLVVKGAEAETYKLSNGETVTGELLIAAANDAGVTIKVGDGEYKKVAWGNFSQEDLRNFAKNKKLEPLVEPFIEVTPEERAKKTEPPPIKQPERLGRPAPQSLFGAMLSSGLGWTILLLCYAANLYAAYEVSIFRAQPLPLVAGVSAVLPVIGPIIFLSMPTRIQPAEPTWDVPPEGAPAEAAAHAGAPDAGLNPMQDASVEHPSGLRLAHSEEAPASALPPTTTYQRGQTTFNRRFFETKFPGFFGVIRRDSDKDMVLLIKSSRGQFVGQRISRIAANDFHLQVQKGHATEEVMIPFMEIQEVQLKHKDA
jgi:hypothetical protein